MKCQRLRRQVRRKADPAKALVKEWVSRWRDERAVATEVSYKQINGVLCWRLCCMCIARTTGGSLELGRAHKRINHGQCLLLCHWRSFLHQGLPPVACIFGSCQAFSKQVLLPTASLWPCSSQ